MATQIFVNLPVTNLQRSMDFYGSLGFTFNPMFTDEKAACMIVGENIFAMLLMREYFATFSKKPVANPHETVQVKLAIDAESKDAVSGMVEKALASGGSLSMDAQDHGWMYQHGFVDPDGNEWEVMYADMSQFPQS